ncbi:MAG: hypothetical protein JXI43_10810 [Tissierellales bacterium]|nr:hypothetical protein [Tissierellales bacterium]
MRFKKIKITSDDKIHLEYEKANKQHDQDQFTMTGSEKALPEFYEAMADLAKFVCEMCELPDTDIERIKVRGVSFSWAGESNTMGAVIMAQKKLIHSNCPLNINTPHKTEEFYAENGDEKQLLPTGCADFLYALCDEAERYLNGERSQTDLFSDKEEEKVQEEEAVTEELPF